MPAARRSPRAAVGGTQEDVRRHNLGTLLGHLHECGPLSRAELTSRMGLNRSTIAALVNELVTLGAVREERPEGGQSGAGRPSLVVTPRSEHVQVLAADLGVDRVVVALVGLGGVVVARRHRRLGPRRQPATVARLLHRLVDAVLADPAAGARIVGMAVSVPGVIRQSDGCVRFAPNLGWVDEPFGEVLAHELPGLPVWIGNDADLGVLAEHRRGAARGLDDVVFIAGDVGVGGGFVLGGHPMLGAGGYAGELGHMVIRPQGGRQCRCGAVGCWETEVGASAIAQALGMAADASSEDLLDAVRELPDDSRALDEVGHYLGLGLASIVNIVNPRMIIVGGLLGTVFPHAEAAVRTGLGEQALAAAGEQVQVALPSLGTDAVLVGASELAWTGLLADPATTLRERAPHPNPNPHPHEEPRLSHALHA